MLLGAELFALVIRAIRERVPGCGVEVLIPDFQGSHAAVETVMRAAPDVLNHNTETVPRLYRQVRLGARYERSLDVLAHAKRVVPATPVKSESVTIMTMRILLKRLCTFEARAIASE